MGTIAKQCQYASMALQHPGWMSFPSDLDTVEIICALSNLGIIKLKTFQGRNFFTLKSHEKANLFLNSFDTNPEQ